jgi:hypothetical protein
MVATLTGIEYGNMKMTSKTMMYALAMARTMGPQGDGM